MFIYTKCVTDHLEEEVVMPKISSVLLAEQIEACVFFVRKAAESEAHAVKCVYKSLLGATLTTERLKVILDRKWLTDDVSGTSNLLLILQTENPTYCYNLFPEGY